MAGNNIHCLASKLSASASRLKENIDSVIEKYNRHFEDDDLISLASMSVGKLGTRGTLKKIRATHHFGTSNLKTTKRRDELLKLKLGWKEQAVDLNVSRAIERECAVALADVDKAGANEPSDAETLSSFDEDGSDYGDDGSIWDEEESLEDQNTATNSVFLDHKELSAGEEDSKSFNKSFDQSLSDESDLMRSNLEAFKDGTMTIVVSSDDEDNIKSEVDSQTEVIQGNDHKDRNCTYVLHSPSAETQRQKVVQSKQNELDVTDSSYVSLSSPKPKVLHTAQNVKQMSFDGGLLPVEINSEGPKARHTALSKSSPVPVKASATFVADKEKGVSGKNARSDGLFKSPQGIKIRRIIPVPIPLSSILNTVRLSPKHSSNSSGFFSGSSPGQCDGNLSFTPKVSQSRADDHFVNNKFRKPIPQAQHQIKPCLNVTNNTIRTKANRVDQWVHMVNTNSTTAKEPLHYPSCPPKIPKFFSPQTHKKTQSRSSQNPSTCALSSDNRRNVGIQTTLNCTIRYAPRKSSSQRVMKDASTLLSNSFLDAHHPVPIPSNPSPEIQGEPENSWRVNDSNVMFPEDYLYKFSPLNPNRIDSDYSANLHQNHCLHQGWKNFRPRRNDKRHLDETSLDKLSFSERCSKIQKLDQTAESMPCILRSQDCSYSTANSYSHEKENGGTFIIDTSGTTPNSLRQSSVHIHKQGGVVENQCFIDQRGNDLHEFRDVARAVRRSSASREHQPAQRFLRASTPLCSNGYENEACKFINSTFSELSGDEDFHDNNNEPLLSPKLSKFLNSSKPHANRYRLQPHAQQVSSEDWIDSYSYSDMIHSSPIKVKSTCTPSPKQTRHRNHCLSRSTNIDRFPEGKFMSDASLHDFHLVSDSKLATNAFHARKGHGTALNGMLDKVKTCATTSLSSCDYLVKENVDNGSFVQAHSPKKRVVESSSQERDVYGFKVKGACNFNLPLRHSSKLTKHNSVSEMAQNSVSKTSSPLDTLFYKPKPSEHSSSYYLQRKNSARNRNVLNNQRELVPDAVSKCRHGYNICSIEDKSNISKGYNFDENGTEEYSLNISSITNDASFVDTSPCDRRNSKRGSLDDMLSTIHGSGEEEIEEECYFDSCIDDVTRQPTNQMRWKEPHSMSQHFSTKTSKPNQFFDQSNASQHYWNTANSFQGSPKEREKPKLNKTRYQPSQSVTPDDRMKCRRGWKTSVWDNIEKQGRQRDGNSTSQRLFRASTPVSVRRGEVTPYFASMNSSMSTIVSPQDKEVDSDDDDDWETKTIGDVDVL